MNQHGESQGLSDAVRRFLTPSSKRMLIGGQWVEAVSGKTFATVNPATADPIATVAEGDAADIDLGEAEGTRIKVGGTRNQEADLAKGYFVKPTVLTQVENRMRVAQEEIFGPVLAATDWSAEQSAGRGLQVVQFEPKGSKYTPSC